MNKIITKKPVLSEYGIENIDYEKLLQEQKEYLEGKNKGFNMSKHPTIAFTSSLLIFFTAILTVLTPINYIINGYEDTFGKNSSNIYIYILFIFLSVVFLKIWMQPINKNPKKYADAFPRRQELENFKKYEEDTKKYNDYLKSLKKSWWNSLSGPEFEKEIANLYYQLGYKVNLTKNGADGGVDIIIEKENKKIAVQCKAHKTKISESVARDLNGVLYAHEYDEGILVTVNGVSKNTLKFCRDLKGKKITILDSDDLIKMKSSLSKKGY